MKTIFHQQDNSKSNYHYDSTVYGEVYWAPHFHRGLELIYLLEGEMDVTVQQFKKDLRPGEFVLILPNQIHSFQSSKNSKLLVVVFSEDFVPKFISSVKGKQAADPSFTCSDTVTALVKDTLIPSESPFMMRKACFYAVCSEYLEKARFTERKDKNDFLMGELLDYIAEHYTENITLKGLAEIFGYEYHYLSRLLSSNYNINFKQLLNQYRTEKALELLQETDMNMTEVAMKSGFQSIRNFNLIFKANTGSSPNEYR